MGRCRWRLGRDRELPPCPNAPVSTAGPCLPVLCRLRTQSSLKYDTYAHPPHHLRAGSSTDASPMSAPDPLAVRMSQLTMGSSASDDDVGEEEGGLVIPSNKDIERAVGGVPATPL